jgi:hypothetical protein
MPASVTRLRRDAIVLIAIAVIATVFLNWFRDRSGTANAGAHDIVSSPKPEVPVSHATVQSSVPTKISPPNHDRIATGRIGSAMDAPTIVNCHNALLGMRPVKDARIVTSSNPTMPLECSSASARSSVTLPIFSK